MGEVINTYVGYLVPIITTSTTTIPTITTWSRYRRLSNVRRSTDHVLRSPRSFLSGRPPTGTSTPSSDTSQRRRPSPKRGDRRGHDGASGFAKERESLVSTALAKAASRGHVTRCHFQQQRADSALERCPNKEDARHGAPLSAAEVAVLCDFVFEYISSGTEIKRTCSVGKYETLSKTKYSRNQRSKGVAAKYRACVEETSKHHVIVIHQYQPVRVTISRFCVSSSCMSWQSSALFD